jgi:hypothetical protein
MLKSLVNSVLFPGHGQSSRFREVSGAEATAPLFSVLNKLHESSGSQEQENCHLIASSADQYLDH